MNDRRSRTELAKPVTDYTCPRCDAKPGESCTSVGADSYARGAPLRRPHAERYRAAKPK